ncbi:MAG: allophanate hydrolase [Pseudomonadales bacterium]|nr:allophanate hydrolase [Pseudomonadales bacterium]MBO7007000.1 allophanate hydrolase [Pseudomonadales bacterium]
MNIESLRFDLVSLSNAYRQGLNPRDLLKEVHRRIALSEDNPIWIHLLDERALSRYIERLEVSDVSALPLYGVPFAIKDNIDLEGVPTTAACPAFSYEPERSSFVVQRLITAGALPIGKTNLDQLATGLVGTRSPFGAVMNSFDSELISGGSSSGSAVAVALGQVCFSLGTDTAGSGRVPAALNNLVGYKPTCGIVSCTGVVPACRTLDSISLFTNQVSDAQSVAKYLIGFDSADAYSKPYVTRPITPRQVRIGVPAEANLCFFGNDEYAHLFSESVKQVAHQFDVVTVDVSCQLEAAKLLYEGAWVAERYHAAKTLIEDNPGELRQEFLKVVSPAMDKTAVDYFDAAYRLAGFRRDTEALFEEIDVLLLPTVGSHFSFSEVCEEPIARNTDNGYYTNFVNLLDLAAVAIPAGFTAAGLPFGVSLIGDRMTDARLMKVARDLLVKQKERQFGASGELMTEPLLLPDAQETMPIAVCGAHLSSMPLNGQLLERGAQLREATTTAPSYRLYALSGGPPKRPGMVRCENGVVIEVEVWDVPVVHIGSFLAGIPAPLGLGKVELASGEWVSGFICEPCGIKDAEDVSGFGGWRGYIQSIA